MSNEYTKAKFWKCALQVNPSSYIAYRGTDHHMTEEDYNKELLRISKEEDIKILGIADHGNVDGVDAIRILMNEHDIIVFPGFEIASTEKIHFVCLFSEDTTKDQLNRYLGALGLTDPSSGVWPSNLGGNELLTKVEELGGFIYAAHGTNNSGILKQKLGHIWTNQKLNAVQIPSSIEDLKGVEGDFYRKVILNKEPAYIRAKKIAVINAKDIDKPETLKNPTATCLIKMTVPSFESFKLAFQDPESRVRLNSDIEERYYSRIESIKITGGYLDELYISFSEHLNSVIGGRGTGKSTLIECIRYVLDMEPIGKNAIKQFKEIINENIAKDRATIEIVIRSSSLNGKLFTVTRRYGQSPTVKDEIGNISNFSPSDLLADIEIYGQNEISDIAKDKNYQKNLLFNRFHTIEQTNTEADINKILKKLKQNREKLVKALDSVANLEEGKLKLSKLEERIKLFKELGLEDKLKIVPLLEKEKSLSKRINKELDGVKELIDTFEDIFPDSQFLSDFAIKGLPHKDTLNKVKNIFDNLKIDLEKILSELKEKKSFSNDKAKELIEILNKQIEEEEEKLIEIYKKLPSSEGKTGPQLGVEYQALLKEIEKIKPETINLEIRSKIVEGLRNERKSLLDDLSKLRSQYFASFKRTLKKLNKKLDNKLRVIAVSGSNRSEIINFLINNVDGAGERRLAWINNVEDFSPIKLAEKIRKGIDELTETDWGITPSLAAALVKLSESKLLELEEMDLEDNVTIELNVKHSETPFFKEIDRLSTGQKCTAILHLLLLENKDPLIIDQPEDNLDNSFIAERIVKELRKAKIARQFIFATHNANIPVFGDAEWIGVLEAVEDRGYMPEEFQGAIDVPKVRDMAAEILEGGKEAFEQRKIKYKF